MTALRGERDAVVDALRTAGSVFAEEEAEILRGSAEHPAELDRMLARRLVGEPLEHVVGHVRFGGLRLSVGPGVFVPRRRTRRLVAAALHAAREVLSTRACARPPVIVEAFSGVAPVASAVREALPSAEIHAVDSSPVALEHARTNLGPDAGIQRGDVLQGLPATLRGRVDVVAAVPPYVPDDAIDLLPHEARDHEPHAALLGGPDGLDHVRALVTQAAQWLGPGGVLLVELHRDQEEPAAEHGRSHGLLPERAPCAGLAPDDADDADDDPWSDDEQTVVLVLRAPGA
ncbi:SAM-dependent methyltransferase [Georgenia sp. Z1491]|uniref:SAM-dependent methyltransferase n=1 Tax=Georgenia sp. Z1491 TaxID=3416707 RepID=UPI003CFB263F